MAIEQDLYYVKVDRNEQNEETHWWLHRRGGDLHLGLFRDRDAAYLTCSLLNAHAAINAEHPMFTTRATGDDDPELPF